LKEMTLLQRNFVTAKPINFYYLVCKLDRVQYQYVSGFSLIVFDITWKGHELLDSIRDDEVWKQTKKATSTLKSVSIGVLKNVASAVLTGIIKQKTGLPL
ncbi:DUF2513 domain-containing protein, partial [Limosilactobacillus reuteri]|uniref:DUF2513 domain-containing protein n=1 Tax=Limosilactobacillus reuteri TaxID=1598 RepID=UPI001E40D6AC